MSLIEFFSSSTYRNIYRPPEESTVYSKTCVKRPLSKRPKIGFQDKLLLNAGQKYCRMLPFAGQKYCRMFPFAGQKYCRMLQGEHSAILLTFIKLPFIIKFFVLSIFFEWPLKTVFTVVYYSSPIRPFFCLFLSGDFTQVLL